MGTIYTKVVSTLAYSSRKDNKQSNYDPDYCGDLQQIEKWRDLCVEQVKETFVQLFPLTDVIGKYLCAIVKYLEQKFLLVSMDFMSMQICNSYSSENMRCSPNWKKEVAEQLLNITQNAVELESAIDNSTDALLISFVRASRQVSHDISLTKLIYRLQLSVLKFEASLMDWMRITRKKLRQFVCILEESDLLSDFPPFTSSGNEKWLGTIWKSLAVSVAGFLLEVRDAMSRMPSLIRFRMPVISLE